jgi:hypothetical protein
MYCLKIQRHDKINRQNFEKFNTTLKSIDIILKAQFYAKVIGHNLKKVASPYSLFLENHRYKNKAQFFVALTPATVYSDVTLTEDPEYFYLFSLTSE